MNVCHVCSGELKTRFSEVLDPQTEETFSIFACEKCGFGHTSPQPSNLSAYYAAYHGGRHGATAEYCAARRLKWLEKSFDARKENSRVLDVGCGEGTFLLKAKENGWETVGTEMNPVGARESGLEVFEQLSEVKKTYGEQSFAAITLWHTLEHFKNPRGVLLEVYELLAQNGVLLIAVPDAGGLQAQIFGKHWLHLDVPRHLFHFNFQSLRELLKQCGFQVKNSWHQEFEYDLLGWSQSGLNKFMPKPNVFFKTLSGHSTNVGSASKLLNFTLGSAFSALSLAAVPFGNFMKKGGTIVVCATKI